MAVIKVEQLSIMSCIPRDIMLIVYRFIHNDLYKKLKKQYRKEFATMWHKRFRCFARSIGGGFGVGGDIYIYI